MLPAPRLEGAKGSSQLVGEVASAVEALTAKGTQAGASEVPTHADVHIVHPVQMDGAGVPAWGRRNGRSALAIFCKHGRVAHSSEAPGSLFGHVLVPKLGDVHAGQAPEADEVGLVVALPVVPRNVRRLTHDRWELPAMQGGEGRDMQAGGEGRDGGSLMLGRDSRPARKGIIERQR